MDYHGQRLAEWLMKIIMWAFGIVGFGIGWLVGTFYVTFFIALLGAIVTGFVIVPEWEFLNKHPIAFPSQKKDKAKNE